MNKLSILLSVPLLLVLSLTFVASNCKKPEPSPSISPEVKAISKDWRVKRVLFNNVADLSADYSTYRRRFNTDGSYSFTDTPGKVKTGKWKLAGNNQRMVLDEATSGEATVIILNGIKENELHLEFTLPADYKHSERKAVYELIP